MTLTPLLSAAWPIPLHAVAAMGAFALGAVQLARPKGTMSHRALGYLWSLLMLTVAASSFFIHELKQWNGFSLIHLLSTYVLAALPAAVFAARRGAVERHRKAMLGLFFFGLVVAGLFTLLPGRIMHAVVFGAM